MSDVNGGLVSNPSDREMQGSRRGSSAHAATTDPNAWELSWVEPHADKRDVGQLSNRKLIEPSASECRIPAYVDKITHITTSTGLFPVYITHVLYVAFIGILS